MPKKRPVKKQAILVDYIAEDLRSLAVPIDALKPDPRNARLHDDANIEAIASSLRRYGQVKPIVIHADTSVIEAGNGTYQAAQKLGWTHLAAVRVKHDATTAKGFALADNRTAELAAWNDELLSDLIAELAEEEPELADALLLDKLVTSDKKSTDLDGSSQLGGIEYRLVITCEGEEHQAELLERFEQEGLKCRALMS